MREVGIDLPFPTKKSEGCWRFEVVACSPLVTICLPCRMVTALVSVGCIFQFHIGIISSCIPVDMLQCGSVANTDWLYSHNCLLV